MKAICQVCGSDEWLNLPDPALNRAVTTAGRIVNEPLGKAQCAGCGFVQRIRASFLGDTDYYEQDYAKYYDRPGTAQFHLARYRVLAEWMNSILQSFSPARILDVGCGQGWAMQAMKSFFPGATIEGLEPSSFNSEVARKKGFVIYEARVGKADLPEAKYDLVYSNNVIQHVTNAREFVESLKDMVSDDGVIITTCPDGSLPNIEILWSDQNFSFLPEHLFRLCREVGFKNVKWFASPPSPSVPPAQMLLLSNDGRQTAGLEGMQVPVANLSEIYEAKCRYLNSFKAIDELISNHIKDSVRVFNFGASYWSSILAAYCPRYWQRVSACLVESADGIEPKFLDKRVMQLDEVTPAYADALVFGTSPATHKALESRFASDWKKVISWDSILAY